MWAMRLKTSGWCRLIQRNLAGDVIETQSPPVSKIFRASPALISSAASSPARESTFGQAQISVPAASYRTMPSRIAVLETPFIALAARPLFASASRMHSQMSGQFLAVSNCCEPGAPGRGGCDHSRCAIAT